MVPCMELRPASSLNETIDHDLARLNTRLGLTAGRHGSGQF